MSQRFPPHIKPLEERYREGVCHVSLPTDFVKQVCRKIPRVSLQGGRMDIVRGTGWEVLLSVGLFSGPPWNLPVHKPYERISV